MNTITNSKISEIERLHELFDLASENAGLGIFYYDLLEHPGYFYAQDKTIELIGGKIRADKLYTDDVWLEFIEKQEDRAIAEHVLEQFQGTWSGKYEFYDVEYPSPSFNPPKWLAAKAKVTKFDEQGQPLNMIGILMDITEQKAQHDLIEKQKKELQLLAYKDQLTELKNRHAFYEYIEEHTATILFIDLDGFKEINDSKGHEAGDLLLQQVATKLRAVSSKASSLKSEIEAYRIAGDEFVVTVAPELPLTNVVELTKELMASLAAPVLINAAEHSITSSIGIAFYNPQHNMETIVQQADMAMYIAKRGGKNRYVVANEFSMAEFHK